MKFSRRHFLKYGTLIAGTTSGVGMACGRADFADPQPRPEEASPKTRAGKARSIDRYPEADGFYFPAEWATHESTLMVFPPVQNWGRRRIALARHEWALTAHAIMDFEPVKMVVAPEDRAAARSLLSADIEVIELPVNDGWARDSGPMFVVNGTGQRRVAGFTFNGWGGKFPPYADDAGLKARLCQLWDVPIYPSRLVLEGGGVIVDGQGTVITTEECLLHPNRNPHLSQAEVESELRRYLGVQTVIWLAEGIVPDPVTDGHVDGLCAYVAPGVVLLQSTEDRTDPNYTICADAKRRLQQARDAQGRKLTVIELPLADQVGHINFYLTNGGLIVPVANQPYQDDRPLGILREVFPDRQVIPVSGVMLANGGGGIHCITQQIPRV